MAYGLLWRGFPIDDGSPFAHEGRRILLAALTHVERTAAIAWVTERHPVSDQETESS